MNPLPGWLIGAVGSEDGYEIPGRGSNLSSDINIVLFLETYLGLF